MNVFCVGYLAPFICKLVQRSQEHQKVTNKDNGRSVIVRINDRGPFVKGRMLDLSRGAASQLGFIGSGQTAVCMARV